MLYTSNATMDSCELKNRNSDQFHHYYDIYFSLPCWAQNVLETSINVLEEAFLIALNGVAVTTDQKKIRSGFILKTILDRFKSKTICRSKSKLVVWLYSGHDSNLKAVLSTFNIFIVKKILRNILRNSEE